LDVEWLRYASIPVIAGLIGYGTNWLAVKMTFAPLEFLGIPPYLGVTHLPGQNNAHYQERWYPFEAGSDPPTDHHRQQGDEQAGAELVEVGHAGSPHSTIDLLTGSTISHRSGTPHAGG
jgi:hypothetical protein